MSLNQTQTLAKFAADLTYDQIPADTIARTKFCIIDTIAACTFGSELPWSKMILKHATTTSAPGRIFMCSGLRPAVSIRPFTSER